MLRVYYEDILGNYKKIKKSPQRYIYINVLLEINLIISSFFNFCDY